MCFSGEIHKNIHELSNIWFAAKIMLCNYYVTTMTEFEVLFFVCVICLNDLVVLCVV